MNMTAPVLKSDFINAPRTYTRHLRHRIFARVARGGADQFNKFLSTQATRLSSTSTVIFTKLRKYTADKIRSASSLSSIP
jgi:hypothetical protein